MKSSVIIALALLIAGSQAITLYNVSAARYSPYPLISTANPGYTYNFNPAAYVQAGDIQLLVRSQNISNNTLGSSDLTSSSVSFNGNAYPSATQPVYEAHHNVKPTEACGSEDPRIAYNGNGLYYIFYTSYNCTNAMLSFATATDPSDDETWIDYGYVFPNFNWSKSAAVVLKSEGNGLVRDHLFWGDSSNPVGGIGIAYSDDGYTWDYHGAYLIKTRSLFFDSYLVEAGPPPVQLKSGDWLFIYNSARDGYPSVKANWTLQYNAGFVILAQNDPSKVLQRSILPLLSPQLAWEVGNTTGYNTPNVVFVTGLVPDPNPCHSGNYECFIAFYGGADTDVGAARIVVNWFASEEVDGADMTNFGVEVETL
jgi:beta-1,2-mannosidase